MGKEKKQPPEKLAIAKLMTKLLEIYSKILDNKALDAASYEIIVIVMDTVTDKDFSSSERQIIVGWKKLLTTYEEKGLSREFIVREYRQTLAKICRDLQKAIAKILASNSDHTVDDL